MKKILLVADCPQWAWGRMAAGIQKHSPDSFDVEVTDQTGLNLIIRTDPLRLPQFDGVCHFSWMEAPHHSRSNRLPIRRLTTLIASHGVEYNFPPDPEDLRSQIATKIRNLKKAQVILPRFASVLCVSRRLHEIGVQLTKAAVRVVPGVDHEKFRYMPPVGREKLVVGWCAQKPEDGRNNTKGYREVLVPLMARLSDVCEFRINSRNAREALTMPEMIEWYAGVDVVLSTSCSEGFQTTLLEGASCGRPVVSPMVGGAEELIIAGTNGYLVNEYQNLTGAAQVIEQLEIPLRLYTMRRDILADHGRAARARIEQEYTWARRAPEWLGIIGG